MPLQYYIGTSGWHYEHWPGRFYPEKLTKARWLEFYVSHFTTVELNNSFYRLPSAAAFLVLWRDGREKLRLSAEPVADKVRKRNFGSLKGRVFRQLLID